MLTDQKPKTTCITAEIQCIILAEFSYTSTIEFKFRSMQLARPACLAVWRLAVAWETGDTGTVSQCGILETYVYSNRHSHTQTRKKNLTK